MDSEGDEEENEKSSLVNKRRSKTPFRLESIQYQGGNQEEQEEDDDC